MSNPRAGSARAPRVEILTLLQFWAPLALIWLIMGVEQPTIGAVVSRLPDPALGLAAFEVAFGLAALFHSPVLQLLSAGTALVVDVSSLRRVVKLFLIVTLVLTTIHLLFGLTPAFALVARHLIGVPKEVVAPARQAFLVLTPITAAVGLRRLLQGAMVRARTTRSISAVIFIRLAATTLFLLSVLGAHWFTDLRLPGAGTIAAAAFSVGVVAGAIAAIAIFRRTVHHLLPASTEGVAARQSVARFYLPLALTGVVMTVGRPLLVLGLGRADPTGLSLAAWPLLVGLVAIFQALGMSYQEVAVARISDDRKNVKAVKRTGAVIGFSLSVLAALVLGSGLRDIWFGVVVSAPAELLPLIREAALILIPMPLIATGVAVYNGSLIAAGRTTWVTNGMLARIAGYITLALLLPAMTRLSGTTVAALMLVVSGVLQLTVLAVGTRLSAGDAPRMSTS